MTNLFAPWAASSFSVLIDPPTEEPITLDEAKLRAGLDWPTTDPPDPRDQLMKDYIAAARSQVERDTGLALLTQTRDLYFAPVVAGQLIVLPAQSLPLQSIESAGPLPPVAAPVGESRSIQAGARGALTVTHHLQAVIDFSAGALVRVIVGWVDAAELRAHAPLLVQAVGLLTAHYATLGRDLASLAAATEVPYGYDDAIASYRLVWIP